MTNPLSPYAADESSRLTRARVELIARMNGRRKPRGRVNRRGYWVPAAGEHQTECCSYVLQSAPHQLYQHCCSPAHVAYLYRVSCRALMDSIPGLSPQTAGRE